ncbi:MAG: hypothetical protein M0R39_15410 [Prolixibacteraceae bacterium]|nr:hypothetical protein [Prolixibacteraceae bacterium]
MKNVAFKLSGLFLLSSLVLSCSKTETDSSQIPLKDALTSSTQNLNSAITDISSLQAFQLLSVSSGSTLKSGTMMSTTTGYGALIPLSLVKGVYDYKALKTEESNHYPLIRFFTKSASTNNMVVNLPLSKLKNPHDMREYHKADSTLTNNFSISVSDYHNNYNNYHDYDYLNVADITIDNVKAGGLSIKSIVSPNHNTQYASQFDFTNGYTAKYLYSSGDTTVSSFTILKAGGILYQEKLLTIKKDTAKFGREHQYILTIGNVKIVRKHGSPAEIYVNGVLDPKAVVTIIDNDEDEDSEHSITNKRDIQITFADGTVSTVSALIGKSITDISTLFTSLHQVYFAAYVVDWIAYDIYYKR